MDIKEAIATLDSLKWEPTAEELRLRKAMEQAQKDNDTDTYEMLFKEYKRVETKPKLLELNLFTPLICAFRARAEWELLDLFDELGEALKEAYGLYISGQDKRQGEDTHNGIGLDWEKLSERIWVPGDYLKPRMLPPRFRTLFDDSEFNYFQAFFLKNGDKKAQETVDLCKAVLYAPYDKFPSDAKINALLKDAEWRANARNFSLKLLECAWGNYRSYIKDGYLQCLETLVLSYHADMR